MTLLVGRRLCRRAALFFARHAFGSRLLRQMQMMLLPGPPSLSLSFLFYLFAYSEATLFYLSESFFRVSLEESISTLEQEIRR